MSLENNGGRLETGSRGQKYRDPILLCFLFVWGTAVCLFYGRIGFMPLDHSAIFDGAWRLLCGQMPFRDFTTPNSIVPIVFQVAFFKLLGVNWFSYCLHASIFNGLFCLLVFFCLRGSGGSSWLSFFYAFLSGLVFYPPYGLPSHDQHAFFFSFLALVVVLFSSRTSSLSGKAVSWFLLPVVLVAAYLSKQVPTVFAAPLVFFILLTTTKKRQLKIMGGIVGLSVLAIIGSFYAALKIFRLDLAQVKSSLWTFPSQMGKFRLNFYLAKYSAREFVKAFFYPRPLEQFSLKLNSFYLIYISAVVVAALLTIWLLKTGVNKKNIKTRESSWAIFMSVALLAICNIFVLFTLNQGENGLPYLFAALGFAHIGVVGLFPARDRNKRTFVLKGTISLFFIIVAAFDGVTFNNQVNRTRMVHDFNLQGRRIAPAAEVPEELKFMVFVMPPHYRFSALSLKKTAEFLRGEKATFFLLGDTSILYALAHRPSTNPVLWFHPGLTIPPVDSEDFHIYEERLLENLRKYKVKYLVLEGDQTWLGLSPGNFKKLGLLVRGDSTQDKDFGGFKVLRIDLGKDP